MDSGKNERGGEAGARVRDMMIVYKVHKVHKVEGLWTPAGRFAHGSVAANKHCPKDIMTL